MSVYCPKCGRENPESNRFCYACGERLQSGEDSEVKARPMASEPKSEPSRILLVLSRSYIGAHGLFMTILLGISCIVILPIFILVGEIVANRTYRYTIYSDKIVIEGGLIRKQRKTRYLSKVLSVSKDQGLTGRLFSFGDVRVNLTGKEDITLYAVKDPDDAVSLFETMIRKNQGLSEMIVD